MWLRFLGMGLAGLEAWALNRLRTSPTFQRSVQNLYKNFHRLKEGKPMEERGGTSIDRTGPSIIHYFKEEIKEQLRGNTKKH